MKSFILPLLLLLSMNVLSQNTYFYFPRQENSAVTTAKMENAQYNLDKAYKAYNKGDLKQTKYYLYESTKDGYRSASFYYLFGQWCYARGKYARAKRYWKAGYNNSGCWECNELIESMKNRKD